MRTNSRAPAVHDELTGLLYLNARHYEPRTGRFITRDSYRGERENADTWHLYAYCANNPINYVDPSGNWFFVPFLLKGAAVVIGGIILAAYTTTREFEDAWNRAARGIGNGIGEVSKYVKSRAKALSKAIGKSFSKAKKRYDSYELHHIVAKKASRAEPARKILKKVGKSTEDKDNLISVKKGLHKRLHRREYHDMVNALMRAAYSKNYDKRKNMRRVQATIQRMRSFIETLNNIAPF